MFTYQTGSEVFLILELMFQDFYLKLPTLDCRFGCV